MDLNNRKIRTHQPSHVQRLKSEKKTRRINLIIDFSINGLCTENLPVTTDPNTVQNYSKLIDLVIRIELTRAILMPRSSNFLRNFIIYFRMFLFYGNMFSESHGFVAMPVTSCIKDTCSNLFQSN